MAAEIVFITIEYVFIRNMELPSKTDSAYLRDKVVFDIIALVPIAFVVKSFLFPDVVDVNNYY